VKSAAGDVQLRVTADTDVEGITDRTEIKPGMRLAALYEISQEVNPSLGYGAPALTGAQ